VRETLWYDTVNSRHLLIDQIIEFLSGLPSGLFATTQINTLVCLIYILLFWIELHDGNLECLAIFKDNIAFRGCGDDHLLGISNKYKSKVHGLAISEWAKKYNMNYTAADKSAPSEKLKSIYEVDFLKRRFRWSDIMGRHVMCLTLDTVLEMPHWTKPSTDFRQKLQTCIWELSLHSKEVYDKYAPEIFEKAYQLGGYEFETSYMLNHMKVCGLDIRDLYPDDVEA